MKLDRNISPDGKGKYALVNLRVLRAFLDRNATGEHAKAPNANEESITLAMKILTDAKIITFGNETPGDQFFVMKYKDTNTEHALRAYASAVASDAHAFKLIGQESIANDLFEFASEIRAEVQATMAINPRKFPD